MRINELAKLCGTTARTLRYYEQKGLLSPGKQANSYRDYTEEDAHRLRIILALKQFGLPLEEIRRALSSMERGNTDEVRRYLDMQRALMYEQWLEMKRLIESVETLMPHVQGEGPPDWDSVFELADVIRRYRDVRSWEDRWDFDKLALTFDQLVLRQGEQGEAEDGKPDGGADWHPAVSSDVDRTEGDRRDVPDSGATIQYPAVNPNVDVEGDRRDWPDGGADWYPAASKDVRDNEAGTGDASRERGELVHPEAGFQKSINMKALSVSSAAMSIQEEERFPGYGQLLQAVTRLVDARSGEHGLEVGVGTGNLLGLLAESGCTMSGVDSSYGMLRQARAKHPGLDLRYGSILAIPYFDRLFDFAAAAYVFGHLTDEQKRLALDELQRVLKRGGRLCIADTLPAVGQPLCARQLEVGGERGMEVPSSMYGGSSASSGTDWEATCVGVELSEEVGGKASVAMAQASTYRWQVANSVIKGKRANDAAHERYPVDPSLLARWLQERGCEITVCESTESAFVMVAVLPGIDG